MKFTVEDFMRNSFVMAKSDEEYFLFCKRMWYGGFDKRMPLQYRGNYPKVLFGGGVNACALNHFVLVNMAKTMNWDHVTIFESDAYPMKDCREKLKKLLDEDGVPDDAHEVIFGNLHFIRDWTNKGKNHKCLVDVDKDARFGHIKDDLWGAHAVVVFRQGYDTWLENYLKQPTQINADFFKWLTPNCYATARSYFIQVKDKLQYPEMICDPEWLDDFPEIGTL